MPATAFALPVPPEKTEALRRFTEELRSRHDEYRESRSGLGISREMAWFQDTPQGGMFVVYVEADDPEHFIRGFVNSDDPFGRWFGQMHEEILGVDLTHQAVEPPPPAELIFEWHDERDRLETELAEARTRIAELEVPVRRPRHHAAVWPLKLVWWPLKVLLRLGRSESEPKPAARPRGRAAAVARWTLARLSSAQRLHRPRIPRH